MFIKRKFTVNGCARRVGQGRNAGDACRRAGQLAGLILALCLSADGHAAARKAAPAATPDHQVAAPLVSAITAQTLPIGLLVLTEPSKPGRSNLDEPIRDLAVPGAHLGIADNNTTGRFTGQNYRLVVREVAAVDELPGAFHELVRQGLQHILLALPGAQIVALADLPAARSILLYNVAARDDALRATDCRGNVLHTVPNRAMLADALAQFLLRKGWKNWLLVIGPEPGDRLYADAIRRAAGRLGSKIVAQRNWDVLHNPHRTAQSEIPVLTQIETHWFSNGYDVVVVADETAWFGEYLPYRTWLPRPVVGTQGLVATAWHRSLEQWGATQLQNRFRVLAGRWMTAPDYAAWAAVRAIGEAATRTKSFELSALRDYLLGEQFALAGFKGLPLSFRRWDHQLRQPVLLAADRALVDVAPIEGFLHPKTELDTLGYDEPEHLCHFNTP